MAVSVENFLARYAEFSKVKPETISIWLDDARLEVSQRVWGNLYEQGVYALTAHFLYSRGLLDGDAMADGAPMRNISGESADGVSVSYGANASMAESFGTYEMTSYGQRYLELRARVRRHILVV